MKLDKCPSCDGSNVNVREKKKDLFGDYMAFWVQCSTCGCKGPQSEMSLVAQADWNDLMVRDSLLCPFCSRRVLKHSNTGGPMEGTYVYCMTCFASGPAAKEKAEAVRLWNTRRG